MAGIYLLDDLVDARRTRDAVRIIDGLPIGPRDKKGLLSEWFDEHEGATRTAEGKIDKPARVRAYDELLGRETNSELRG